MQQQRRGRAAEAQHVLAALRKLRALDTILTVGRLLPEAERGASAGGEAVLVECLQCILALVRGNGTMRAHFRRDIQLANVLALVHDCMGAAKVQRNVLAVVLGIALEAKYDSAKPPPQVRAALHVMPPWPQDPTLYSSPIRDIPIRLICAKLLFSMHCRWILGQS